MKKRLTFLGALTLLSVLLFPVDGFGQAVRVSGTITDNAGVPIVGAQVVDQQRTTNAAITDPQGRYSIQVAGDSSLSFSFLGFEGQVLEVNGRTEINVSLEPDNVAIDEVVVIGYGTQLRSDVTGAIASVRAADLNNRSATDAGQALQGKAAGVFILNLSGAPGEGTNIRVRGYSSNSGNIGPLLIVDGLKVDNIQYLDPSMIESMEVLKDAASAAIYGAEAGNGVVLITTKRGKQGEGRIFYNYQHTISSLGKVPEMMNAQQYIGYNKEAGLLTDATLQANNYRNTDTNWAKEVFGRGSTQRHTIGFEGGNERGSYYMSLNNISDNGMLRGDLDVYKRLSAQINADYKVKTWLQVGANISFEKWSTKSVSQRNAFASVLTATVINDPLTPVYFDSLDDMPDFLKTAVNDGLNVMRGENGKYYAVSKYIDNDSGNPFIQRDRARKNTNEGINTRGTFFANFTPIKGLVVTSRFGFRMAQGFSKNFTEPYFANTMAKENNYTLSNNSTSNWYYQWENFANYNKQLGKHSIGAMAGMSYIESRSFGVNGSITGPDPLSSYADNFLYLNYANASATRTIEGNSPSISRNMSYFGRLSYSYDNRYMIQANFRADAFDSSKLSREARWGYFPSVSVGWTISNEEFMKDFARSISMDNLRLRASWGRNGNVNVLRDYRYNATIAVNGRYYPFGATDPTLSYGSMPSGLVNPNLKWETSDQIDIGLDMHFMRNRLSVSLDYYDKQTKDLLVEVTPPREIGVNTQWANAGEVSNRGFELELGWQDRIGDFRYSINGNMATLRNRVTYLDPSLPRLTAEIFAPASVRTTFEKGYPIWYLRGYEYTRPHRETGAPQFVDQDGDGAITDADMTMIGSGIPDVTYGLTLNMGWKNLDLTVFGMGVAGNEIFSAVHRNDRPLNNSLAMFYEQRWTESNRNAPMPSPATSAMGEDGLRFWSSTANVFKGNYFKIKQIQLGYTIPERLTRKVFVQSLRVFVSLDDYFMFTKYPGFDPETSSLNNGTGMGADLGAYPTSRKVMFGVNVTF